MIKREDISLAIRERGTLALIITLYGATAKLNDPDDRKWIQEARAELDYRQQEWDTKEKTKAT